MDNQTTTQQSVRFIAVKDKVKPKIVTREQFREIKRNLKKAGALTCFLFMLITASAQIHFDIAMGVGQLPESKYDKMDVESQGKIKTAFVISPGVSYIVEHLFMDANFIFSNKRMPLIGYANAGYVFKINSVSLIPYAGYGYQYQSGESNGTMNYGRFNAGARVKWDTGIEQLHLFGDMNLIDNKMFGTFGLSTSF